MMADENKTIMSVITTSSTKVKDLVIKDGQLIFVRDKQRIALDFEGKRVFYNQIILLTSENDRQSILAPINGLFYFVIETAILWTYENSNWIQITYNSSDIVFIGDRFPQEGNNKEIYINKSEKNISIWDENTRSYEVVADKTNSITEADINNLFI